MARRPLPPWASPHMYLHTTYLPILAYHRKPTRASREYLVRGGITLALGLSSVVSMILYEAGKQRAAFAFGIMTATIGAFVGAAQVMAIYNPDQKDQNEKIN